MKILIADDDAVSRHLLESTLNRLGHEVIAVADGSAATAALLDKDGPHLAILDWMMPGADGLMVCRAVRQRTTPYVYVILLTSRQHRDDMVAAFDAGVDDFLTKPFDAIELRARLRSGERVLELHEGLLKAATHDGLTGLWNRTKVLDQLNLELDRAARDRKPLALVMADLDRFKQINDTCGHGAGDAVLREVAVQLRSVLRSYDGLSRYGGEEFVMLLPGCEALAALEIAERARAAVEEHAACKDDVLLPITISLGIACTSDGLWEPGKLMAAADEALYRAKAKGRNCVAIWDAAGSRLTR